MATVLKNNSDRTDSDMLEAITPFAKAGFAVHYLHPKSKRPIGNDWSEAPVASLDQLRRNYTAGNNVGVRLGKPSALIGGGYLHAIDLDIRIPELAGEAWAAFSALFPDVRREDLPEVRSGSGGESRHLYFVTDRPFNSKLLAHSDGKHRRADGGYSNDWELELFGTGKQVVMAPSIHPVTGTPYTWVREFDFDAFEQPWIPAAVVEQLGVVDAQTFACDTVTPVTFEPGQLERELAAIPVSDLHYDDWIRLGQALYHQFGGSQEGLDLWEKHTRRSTKFTGDAQLREMRRIKWRSFGKYRGKPVTMLTVRRWYLDAHKDLELVAQVEGLDDLDDNEQGVASNDNDFDALLLTPRPEDEAVFTAGDEEESESAAVARLNRDHAIVVQGGKTLISTEKEDGVVEFGTYFDFKLFHENDRRRKPGSKGGEDPSRYESVAAMWIRHPDRLEYPNGVVFAPGGTPKGALNLWKGWAVNPDPEGSCDLLLNHVRDVVCQGNLEHAAYVFGWMAHLVQKPEEKPGVALILRGLKGTGKDTLGDYLAKMIGRRHAPTVSQSDHITGKFNRHFEATLLLHVQEGIWAGNHEAESQLKALVTSESLQIERKHVDPISLDNFMRVMITSNADWTVPASFEERRWAVFDVSDRHAEDHAYFAPLRAELNGGGPAALLAWLQAYDISAFNVRAAPKTAALMGQKLASLRNLPKWWFERLGAGELDSRNGYGDDWSAGGITVLRSTLRDEYTNWHKARKFEGELVAEKQFGALLRKMVGTIDDTRPVSNGERVRAYVLPDLLTCRQQFEKYMGDIIDWTE